MLALLLSTTLSATVPTASDVLLSLQTPTELTRLLLAQAPTQTEEEKNLEADMDRARQHLGHDAAGKSGDEPAATTAPPPPVPTDDDQDQTAPRKKKTRRAEQGTKYRALSPDGHGKVYYMVWGIVDWNIAGGLWVTAAVLTLYGLAFIAAAQDSTGCVDNWNNGNSTSCAKPSEVRRAGVIMAGLGVTFGAGGGIAAWRAASNIGTYRDLKNEERAHRDGMP